MRVAALWRANAALPPSWAAAQPGRDAPGKRNELRVRVCRVEGALWKRKANCYAVVACDHSTRKTKTLGPALAWNEEVALFVEDEDAPLRIALREKTLLSSTEIGKAEGTWASDRGEAPTYAWIGDDELRFRVCCYWAREPSLVAAIPEDDLQPDEAEWPNCLVVRVVRAKEVKAMDWALLDAPKSDPLVSVSLGGETVTTATVKSNLNPVWDDARFEFDAADEDAVVTFEVKDEDRFLLGAYKNYDFLGRAEVRVGDLAGPPERRWFELGGRERTGKEGVARRASLQLAATKDGLLNAAKKTPEGERGSLEVWTHWTYDAGRPSNKGRAAALAAAEQARREREAADAAAQPEEEEEEEDKWWEREKGSPFATATLKGLPNRLNFVVLEAAVRPHAADVLVPNVAASADPYCRVSPGDYVFGEAPKPELGRKQKRRAPKCVFRAGGDAARSKTLKHVLHPKWDEAMTVKLDAAGRAALRVEVVDDTNSDDDDKDAVMGVALVKLGDVLDARAGATHEGWFGLDEPRPPARPGSAPSPVSPTSPDALSPDLHSQSARSRSHFHAAAAATGAFGGAPTKQKRKRPSDRYLWSGELAEPTLSSRELLVQPPWEHTTSPHPAREAYHGREFRSTARTAPTKVQKSFFRRPSKVAVAPTQRKSSVQRYTPKGAYQSMAKARKERDAAAEESDSDGEEVRQKVKLRLEWVFDPRLNPRELPLEEEAQWAAKLGLMGASPEEARERRRALALQPPNVLHVTLVRAVRLKLPKTARYVFAEVKCAHRTVAAAPPQPVPEDVGGELLWKLRGSVKVREREISPSSTLDVVVSHAADLDGPRATLGRAVTPMTDYRDGYPRRLWVKVGDRATGRVSEAWRGAVDAFVVWAHDETQAWKAEVNQAKAKIASAKWVQDTTRGKARKPMERSVMSPTKRPKSGAKSDRHSPRKVAEALFQDEEHLATHVYLPEGVAHKHAARVGAKLLKQAEAGGAAASVVEGTVVSPLGSPTLVDAVGVSVKGAADFDEGASSDEG